MNTYTQPYKDMADILNAIGVLSKEEQEKIQQRLNVVEHIITETTKKQEQKTIQNPTQELQENHKTKKKDKRAYTEQEISIIKQELDKPTSWTEKNWVTRTTKRKLVRLLKHRTSIAIGCQAHAMYPERKRINNKTKNRKV